jgi:DNA-binding FrmR family transcriptional regulator
MMTDPLKHDAKLRLHKIAGQVSGLEKMVDAERPCLEVLQQLASVKSALEQISVHFLSEHLQNCVLHSGEDPAPGCGQFQTQEEQAAEIRAALRRFMRHNKNA